MATPIEHKEPYEWSYKRNRAALRAEAVVWAEVEQAKGGTCAPYDLLVEYETHCRRQEQRGCAPTGFCSWCAIRLNPVAAHLDDGYTPMLPHVKARYRVRV